MVPSTEPSRRSNRTRSCGISVMRSRQRSPRNSISRTNTVSLSRWSTWQCVIAGTNGSALSAFITSPFQTSLRVSTGWPGSLTGMRLETSIMISSVRFGSMQATVAATKIGGRRQSFIISSGGGGPQRFALSGPFGQTLVICGLSRCHGRGSNRPMLSSATRSSSQNSSVIRPFGARW